MTPKRDPVPAGSNSSLPPSLKPWQSPICFPSLWICLFLTFQVNGTIQYVVFYFWLFSLYMFSRFIFVVACITVSFLLLQSFK